VQVFAKLNTRNHNQVILINMKEGHETRNIYVYGALEIN
jgi:hypothetical protein